MQATETKLTLAAAGYERQDVESAAKLGDLGKPGIV